MFTMTRTSESTAPTACLLLAFELGQRSWKLGFTVGLGQRARIRQIPAGALAAMMAEIERAKKHLGLPADAKVASCYEAGRDGFWLHRYLTAQGITNHVVDSSSIEVNRRARRAKTDRLDLAGLLSLLARYVQGDKRAWRVVRVPTVAEEDARHLPPTLERDRCAFPRTAREGVSLGRSAAACGITRATDPHLGPTGAR
jgi:transposase